MKDTYVNKENLLWTEVMKKKYLKYLLYTDFYRVYSRKPSWKDNIKLFLGYQIEPGVKFLRIFRKCQYAIENKCISKRYWLLKHQFASERFGIFMPITVKIGKGFALYHINGVVINGGCIFGDNCSVLQQVTVGMGRTGVPKIGNDCQLTAGAKIIGDVVVEDGVTIGANAVITHNCPKNTVWGGVPGKLLKNEKIALPNIDFMSFEEWKKYK